MRLFMMVLLAVLSAPSIGKAAVREDDSRLVRIVWKTSCIGCVAGNVIDQVGTVPPGVTVVVMNVLKNSGTCEPNTPPNQPACHVTKECKLTLKLDIFVDPSFQGYVEYWGNAHIRFNPGRGATFTDVIWIDCGAHDGADITWYNPNGTIGGAIEGWELHCSACAEGGGGGGE